MGNINSRLINNNKANEMRYPGMKLLALLLAAYCMLSGFIRISAYLVLVVILGYYLFIITHQQKRITISKYNILQIVCGFLMLLNAFFLSDGLGRNYGIFFFVMSIFMVILQSHEEGLGTYLCPWLLVFSLFFVAMTLLQFLNITSFLSIAVSMLSGDNYQNMYNHYLAGAYAGLTGQPQNNGWMINVGIGVVIASYSTLNKNIYRTILIVLASVSYFALILTHKRDLMLVPVAMILFFIFIEGRFNLKKTLKFILVGAVLVLGLAIMIDTIPAFTEAFIRFTVAGNYGGNDFTSGRIGLWTETINQFMRSPIIGIGIYNTQKVLWGQLPHNIYLQLLAETGIITTTLIVIMLVINIIKSITVYRKLCPLEQKWILRFSIYIQMTFLLEGFTEHVMSSIFYTSLYMVCVALALNKSYLKNLSGGFSHEKSVYYCK